MTDDLVKRLRADNDESFVETLCGEAADRIDTLTAQLESTLKDRKLILEERDRIFALMLARAEKAEAERDQWIQHAKNAVWSDSEELKLLTADNARLQEALDAAFPIVRKASVAAKMDAVNASPSDPTALRRETWMRECDAALELVVSARAALNTGKEPSHE